MHPEVCMFACDGEERDQDSRGWGSEGRFEHIYGLRELAEGTHWKIQGERRELKEKSPGESLEERFAPVLKRKTLSGQQDEQIIFINFKQMLNTFLGFG